MLPAFIGTFGEIGECLERWYVALVHSQTFDVPQLIIAKYHGYFDQQAYTLWPDVRGLGWIVVYPYDIGVPRLLGAYYYDPKVGMHAGMWAQDGIVALGLTCILVVSSVVAVLCWGLDSIASHLDTEFVVLSLGLLAISFTNVALGTTILSGGGFLFALALWTLYPPESRPRP